ncbi:MAG: hypothetical protein JSS12_09585, partial [Verrucomicrobia bacterium]|nr:hypothetical protein [Verrucomicrobiota bacterium]
MSYITGTSPLQSASTSESSTLQNYCSFIKDAFAKGFITPQEQKLSKNSRHDYGCETWLKRLKDFAKAKGIDTPKSLKTLAPCYLFAVAVSEDLAQAQKEQRFKECLVSLDKEGLKNTYYFCISSSSPAVMSLALLRYFSTADWQESLQLLFRYSDVSSFEEPLVAIMKEVATNEWPQQEKEAFLNTMFDRLPKERAEDLYCNFVLTAPEKEVLHFRAACSPVLAQSLQVITDEIQAYTEKTVQELTEQPKCPRLAYERKTNKRDLFIARFFANQQECSVKDLIAADFTEEDWQWLHGREGFKACTFAMSCLVSIAERLANGTIILQERGGDHDSHLWLFFSYATKFIDKNKGYNSIANGDYKRLATLLPASSLVHYFNAFSGEFEKMLMQAFLAHEPVKVAQWMKLLSQTEDRWRSTAAKNMADLFENVIKHNGLEAIISLIYTPDNSEAFKASAFAAAPQAAKTAIIKALFCDREQGMRTLEQWVHLCTPRQATSEETLRPLLGQMSLTLLKPFVREALVTHLHNVIVAFDPNIATELRQRLTTSFQDDSAAIDFVEALLPEALDLNDPVARSNNALKKLKRHFETPHIEHNDREQLVRSLYKDLKGDLSKEAFIAKLFDALPPQSWPLVFLHFEHDIAGSSYMAYYEEKSGGGSFKRTDKNTPARLGPKPADDRMGYLASEKAHTVLADLASEAVGALQDLLMWGQLGQIEEAFAQPQEATFADEQRWIEVAATALTHMIDNPCLLQRNGDDSPAAWAMQHLYQAACNTNTIHKIMQRFIVICPRDRFINTINRFGQTAFYHNPKGCLKLVADSIDESGIDKTQFIVECIATRGPNTSRHGGGVDL